MAISGRDGLLANLQHDGIYVEEIGEKARGIWVMENVYLDYLTLIGEAPRCRLLSWMSPTEMGTSDFERNIGNGLANSTIHGNSRHRGLDSSLWLVWKDLADIWQGKRRRAKLVGREDRNSATAQSTYFDRAA